MKNRNYKIKTYNLEYWRYYYLYNYAMKFNSHVTRMPDISESLKNYDAFLSYSHRDKSQIASPLATALKKKNELLIWFDDFEVNIGDNLETEINQGIIQSQFAVVIISPSYIANEGWAYYEWKGIQQRNVYGKIEILPVWHGVSASQLIDVYPTFTVDYALNTSDNTIDEIAEKIARKVRMPKRRCFR